MKSPKEEIGELKNKCTEVRALKFFPSYFLKAIVHEDKVALPVSR